MNQESARSGRLLFPPVVLGIAGEKLTVDAPEGAIEPNLLAELRQHKESLLDMVKRGWPGTVTSQLLNDSNGATLPNADVVPWQERIGTGQSLFPFATLWLINY